jgi:hypothetical protein
VSGGCFHGQREARAPSVARVPGAGAAVRRNVWRLMLSGAAARAGACSASLCESEHAPRAFGSRCRFASPSGTTAHAMPTSSCTELRIAGSMQSGARAETTRCRPKQRREQRRHPLLLPQGRGRRVRGLDQLFAVHRHERRRARSAGVQPVSGCRRRGAYRRRACHEVWVDAPAPSALRPRGKLTAGWSGHSLAAGAITSCVLAGSPSCRSGISSIRGRSRALRGRVRGGRQWRSAASAEPAVELDHWFD